MSVVDPFSKDSILHWLGDAPGFTTVRKVRTLCQKLQEAVGTPLLPAWIAIYGQVATTLRQDTSLWMSDYSVAMILHTPDMDAGFDNIDDAVAQLDWPVGETPAIPGTVERLPYLCALLDPRNYPAGRRPPVPTSA